MGMEGDYRWDERNNFDRKESKPMEFKRISKYDINIRHTANGGCIVNVGCCEAAFSNSDELIDALTEYYDDPEGMEKKYNAIAIEDGPRNVPTGAIGYGATRECMPDPDNRALRRSGPHHDEPDDCCQEERIEHPGNN